MVKPEPKTESLSQSQHGITQQPNSKAALSSQTDQRNAQLNNRIQSSGDNVHPYNDSRGEVTPHSHDTVQGHHVEGRVQTPSTVQRSVNSQERDYPNPQKTYCKGKVQKPDLLQHDVAGEVISCHCVIYDYLYSLLRSK